MKVIYAPETLSKHYEEPTVFLAGSIEMNKAVEWQSYIIKELKNLPITIFNPRRLNWNNSWEQTIKNKHFVQQVNWELDAMELADLIVMYFDPGTKSPITLFELGLHIRSNKLVVCCPEGFWRKGNIQIYCNRYNIPLVSTLADLIHSIKLFIELR